LTLRQFVNVAYVALTENAHHTKEGQDAKRKLDMTLSMQPATGMLGQPNRRHAAKSVGTDSLMALMGAPPGAPVAP